MKDKNSHTKLMGFGHRVYKNFDPRAKIMKETCHEVLAELGIKDEPAARHGDGDGADRAGRTTTSSQRKLYPNVDFYSGIILKAMGIPTHMFTVLFAVARTVGWVSQWKELIEDPAQRIGRPRQIYRGADTRDYVAVDRRG